VKKHNPRKTNEEQGKGKKKRRETK